MDALKLSKVRRKADRPQKIPVTGATLKPHNPGQLAQIRPAYRARNGAALAAC